MNLKDTEIEIIKKHSGSLPVSIVDIARELGVKVYNADFNNNDEKNTSGVLKKERDGAYSIYVNRNEHPNRKTFTIAHELAHFLLHKDQIDNIHKDYSLLFRMTPTVSIDATKRKMEQDANELAANILMPEEKFFQVWQESDSIKKVANTFGVSEIATTIRAQRLGIPIAV
ncbi:MAG: ImmA/IrrE family metallo-endopeptidase [bacterium]